MDERCVDCPWFDSKKKTCYRKPPRFCEVDLAAVVPTACDGMDVTPAGVPVE